jgi:hypothetical protein
VLAAGAHFGHREADGIVVDLFWNHGELKSEFRVEVRTGATELAWFSTRRPGEKHSRPSTTRSR